MATMIQDLNEALTTCEALTSDDAPEQPTWTSACQTVGNILTSMGFIVEAYPWHSMALDLSPNVGRFYAESGRVYSQCEVWDKAAYYCQLTLKEDPDNLKVRHHLAKVYNKLGDHRAESKILNELLELSPRKATAQGHLDLGWLLQSQGQREEAEKCFKRAIERNGQFSEAYYALGDLYLQQGNTDEAIALFQQLVDQLANQPDEAVEDPETQAADAQSGTQDSAQDGAQDSEGKPAQSLTSARAMADYRLGKAYRQAQQFEPAITHFRNALEKDNRLHWAYMGLMNVLMQLQKWDEVTATCDSIVQSVEAFPWAYTFKGNALARKGDTEQAAIAHQQAFALRGWPQCAERGYEFSHTWFGENIPIWEEFLAGFNEPDTSRQPLQILSLGSSDISSLCWLVDRVLQQPQDKLICITPDVTSPLQNNVAKLVKNESGADKVVFDVGHLPSKLAARDLEPTFEIIYVQSGNKEGDFVKTLATAAWPLLKPDGIMIFKDYQWRHPTEAARSAWVGIDAFMSSVADSVEVLHQSHQIMIKKAIPFHENP